MSCVIVTKETVSKVAHFVAALLNRGFDQLGFSADEFCYMAFKDCMRCGRYDEELIYHSLFNLNYKAYESKYCPPVKEDYSKEIPEYKNLRMWDVLTRKRESFGDGWMHEVVQDWHYEAYKRVFQVHYNISEDINENELKVEALVRIMRILAEFIVSHTPVYHELKVY